MGTLTQHFQDSLLLLCIQDTEVLRLIRPAVDPSILASRETQSLLGMCFDFFDKYEEAPDTHFQDELFNLLEHKNDDEQDLYIRYIERLYDVKNPSKTYVLRKLSDFVHERKMDGVALEFAKSIKAGQYSQAENMMYNALRSGIQSENQGTDYFKSSVAESRVPPLMRSCIPALDKCIGGFWRAQFISIWGGYKGGKSWLLLAMARAALMQGLDVLHISHEMTDRQMINRYDMMLGGMCDSVTPHPWKEEVDKRKHLYNIKSEMFNPETRRIEMMEPMLRSSIDDISEVRKARRQLMRFGGKLILKKFPMGSASMKDLYRYINYLEAFEGFAPSVIINDYADIMAPMDPSKQTRDQLNESYIWHKRLADERDIIVFTVSQIRREAARRNRIRMDDVAEDARKAGHTDLTLGISQTPQQEPHDQRNLFVVASREGAQGRGCVLGGNLAIGQIALWSALPHELEPEEELQDDTDNPDGAGN